MHYQYPGTLECALSLGNVLSFALKVVPATKLEQGSSTVAGVREFLEIFRDTTLDRCKILDSMDKLVDPSNDHSERLYLAFFESPWT